MECVGWTFKKILRYVVGFVAFIILVASVLLFYLAVMQPIYYFPVLTGPYQVGTRTFYFHSSRGEENNRLELVTQFWYPTSQRHVRSTRALHPPSYTYLPDYVSFLRENTTYMWLLFYAMNMQTYAQPNAPILDEKDENGARVKLPLVFYSHGHSFTRGHSTAYCEELASHGYAFLCSSYS
jgi:hypothetical protein